MIYKIEKITKKLNEGKVISLDLGTENVLIYNNVKGKYTIVCYSDLKDHCSTSDNMNAYPNVCFDSVLKIALSLFKGKDFTIKDVNSLIFDIDDSFNRKEFNTGFYKTLEL